MIFSRKFYDALGALLVTLSVIMMPMNFLGSIVSGIWLSVLGEWGTIGYGLLIGIGGIYFLSIPLILSLAISVPIGLLALKIEERGGTWLAAPFILLATIPTHIIIISWSIGIIYLFVDMVDRSSYIPALIWAYGIATGPWDYMAQKESQGPDGNPYSPITAFFTQLATLSCVVYCLIVGMHGIDIINLIIIQVLIHMLGLCVNALIAAEEASRRKDLYF